MTTDQDPLLQKLFDAANQSLNDDEFNAGVMSKIDALRSGRSVYCHGHCRNRSSSSTSPLR